ncbi:hypothetical protein CY0110_15717 [Crocosphaera chwakensis CCY0110]|uniref:Uncharacterized protein n=1 Tax=Crocosphaera chwakensis CCY0110 TaxID=391612 RepID=A3IHH5_9CHRO|nr:hypothetical protein CY0110_15717 [Crocosphaera chwakensis CCY0110]
MMLISPIILSSSSNIFSAFLR